MKQRRRIAMFCLLVAIQIVIALLCDEYFRAKYEQTPVITVTRTHYGTVVGMGLIRDADNIQRVLDCVDNLEFFNDDINNICSGGGYEVAIFQGGTVRRYVFVMCELAKDCQDENSLHWYRYQGEMLPFLEECLQKRYPYPEY